MRIRGGSGLGDSVYIRPVAEYFIQQGIDVTVMSNYGPLFDGSGASVKPFKKYDIDVIAHYASHRRRQETNQFQDVCETAGIPQIPLTFSWTVSDQQKIDAIRELAAGRKIILVHGGREPLGRGDGLGLDMMPRQQAYQRLLDELADCFTVRIGMGKHFYNLQTSIDLVDKTGIAELVDLFRVCDGVVTQCGNPIPLAECFDKPVLVLFGAAGLNSGHPIIRLVTPAKVLCKPSSTYAVDDWNVEKIKDAVSGFRQF